MSENTVTLTDAEFDTQVLQASQPTLVDFWAEWCAPCRAIAPVVEEIAASFSGKVQVGKMNIEEQPQTATKYSVRAIPTLLIFKDGDVVEQIVGLASKSKLEDLLNKHIS